MAKRKRVQLTQAETGIMRILWEQGESTVRDVLNALPEKNRPAYTTVMTLMGILHAKGFLKRRKKGKAYLYRPADRRELVEGSILGELLERVFNNSRVRMLSQLIDFEAVDDEELAEMERIIRRHRQKSKG